MIGHTPDGIIPSFNILSSNAELKGDIITSGDFRIDGKLTGNISCGGKLTLGITGIIEGDISCSIAEISGKISGNIKAEELIILKETSSFTGDLSTKNLSVEPGSFLSMRCDVDNIDSFKK